MENAMIYDTIIAREPVEKGWSGDRKFRAVTGEGERYLLRIVAAEREERTKKGFARMWEAAALGIPMCLPVELGRCEEGMYVLHSWIDGTDAETVIPGLEKQRQYAYGLDAGRILKKLHTLPAPPDAPSWVTRYGNKIDRKLAMYAACPLKYERGDLFLSFISENRSLLTERPQSYQHGDYHIGNMMVDTAGQLVIIDFDRDDFGDPWEEFNRIVWCAQKAPVFATGMVDGYFDGQVPEAFWRLLALYMSNNCLSSLPWAVTFGEREIRTMQRQAEQVLGWYDGMKRVVPSWYTF